MQNTIEKVKRWEVNKERKEKAKKKVQNKKLKDEKRNQKWFSYDWSNEKNKDGEVKISASKKWREQLRKAIEEES